MHSIDLGGDVSIPQTPLLRFCPQRKKKCLLAPFPIASSSAVTRELPTSGGAIIFGRQTRLKSLRDDVFVSAKKKKIAKTSRNLLAGFAVLGVGFLVGNNAYFLAFQ